MFNSKGRQRAALAGVLVFGLACGLATAVGIGADTSAAKREGVVVWYGTMNTKDMNLTAEEFMRTHPGIRVETLRATSSQLPARVITEQRGGKFNADVISGDEFQVVQLVNAGALTAYRPPDTAKYIGGTVDSHGFWTNLYMNTTVIAWNPSRLKADHLTAPTSDADFASPAWKGKFGVDAGAFNWYQGLLQVNKNAADLAKRIAANDPIKTSGHTETVTQIEAGEIDGSPTVYGYLAAQEKRTGKNLDFINPNPLFVTLNPIGMAKNAPHPDAAKVFIDWMVSREGQQYIAQSGGGEISSRTDVRNNSQIWNPKGRFVVVRAPNEAQYADLVHEFRSIFGIPQ